MSKVTVRNNLIRIYSTVGVSDRLELTLYAVQNKIMHA